MFYYSYSLLCYHYRNVSRKVVRDMMDYNMMSGMYGSGYMTFGWLFGLLVLINLVLGVAALWKYVSKK